jgi:hypothetical protein
MYDKYSKFNPITLNAVLPKHKGLLVIAGANGAINIDSFKTDSSILSMGLTFAANTTNIVPFQVQKVTTLGTGLTAFYLN